MATVNLPDTGTGDNAGDGSTIRAAWTLSNANTTAINNQLDAFTGGSALDPSGQLDADPTTVAAALAAGMSVNQAIWQVYRNQGSTPANVIVQAAPYDASTNSPDLTVAAQQGETDPAGNWIGYEWTVGTEGTQDLGGGSTLFRPGDTILFAAANTPLHRDNSPSVVAHGVVTGAQTLPAATGSGVMHLYVLDSAGAAVTVAPAAGEQINGTVDLVMSFDSGSSVVSAVDAAAGQWAVGPNVVTAPADVLNYYAEGNQTLLDGLVELQAAGLSATNAAPSSSAWTVAANQFVYSGPSRRFRFEASLAGGNGGGVNTIRVYARKNGGGGAFSQSYVTAAAGDAVTHSFSSVIDLAAGDTLEFSQDGTGNVVYRTVQVTVTPEPTTFQTGTLIAEPAEDLLIGPTAFGSGASTIDLTGADLSPYIRLRIEAEVGASGVRYYWDREVPIDRLSNLRVWESNGGSQFQATFDAAGTTISLSYLGSFAGNVGQWRIYGVRDQFNAIRAEDHNVDYFVNPTVGEVDTGKISARNGKPVFRTDFVAQDISNGGIAVTIVSGVETLEGSQLTMQNLNGNSEVPVPYNDGSIQMLLWRAGASNNINVMSRNWATGINQLNGWVEFTKTV